MRTLIVSIAVSALIVSAMFAVKSSQAQVKPTPTARPHWEYKVVTIRKLIGGEIGIDGEIGEDEITASLEKHFNTLGNDGWELCQEMNGGLVFKRKR